MNVKYIIIFKHPENNSLTSAKQYVVVVGIYGEALVLCISNVEYITYILNGLMHKVMNDCNGPPTIKLPRNNGCLSASVLLIHNQVFMTALSITWRWINQQGSNLCVPLGCCFNLTPMVVPRKLSKQRGAASRMCNVYWVCSLKDDFIWWIFNLSFIL